MEPLRVSTKSQPKSVAGAVAAMINEHQRAEILAVGAGAVNQAIKAIAITRGFMAPRGIEIVVIPAFANIEIDGILRTSIKLIVEVRLTNARFGRLCRFFFTGQSKSINFGMIALMSVHDTSGHILNSKMTKEVALFVFKMH